MTEAMRMPLWFWNATGDEEFLRLGRGVVSAMDHWVMPSGALVSMESVDRPPQPWNVAYEYCTIFEREFTLLSAAQKLGDAAYADAVEHLWFNAAQGSRVPDGTAVLYLSAENRLAVQDEFGRGQRFSPTHQHRAVCCNPNATRVAAYYTAGMWMRPRGPEPAIAAMLYGPSQMTADIAGSAVSIEEKTLYPYSGEVELTVRPAKPVTFCLWLRDPSWSRATQIACPGAEVRQVGRLLAAAQAVAQRRQGCDPFRPGHPRGARRQRRNRAPVRPAALRAARAGNHQDHQDLPEGRFRRLPDVGRQGRGNEAGPAGVAASQRFRLHAEAHHCKRRESRLSALLENPPVVLQGKLVRESDGTLVPVTLVPMGAAECPSAACDFSRGRRQEEIATVATSD